MLNYIKLFWFKPGSSREEVFDEKYGKQYEVMTDFCFGVNDGNTTLKGQTAIDRLMQPDWDGKTFAEHIPIIPDAPSPVILTNEFAHRYPDELPTFRTYTKEHPNFWYTGYNKVMDEENGYRTVFMLYARNEEDLKHVWDYFGITHWEDPQISSDEESYKPNPEYDIWLAERERLVTKWQNDISRTWSNGCQLIFVGTVIFPVIPDTPDTQWRLIQPDGTRIRIPVEVGKYSTDKKFRVRKVVDFETGNRINSYNMLVNNAMEVAKNYSPEKAVQYLTGVVRSF
jgi:hypothetical protein